MTSHSPGINTSESGESAHDSDRPPLNTGVPFDSPAATPLVADINATDARSSLKLLRIRNIGKIIIGYLNINSVRNKFDAVKEIISQNLDVLMLAETKIDPTFPTGQFAID